MLVKAKGPKGSVHISKRSTLGQVESVKVPKITTDIFLIEIQLQIEAD